MVTKTTVWLKFDHILEVYEEEDYYDPEEYYYNIENGLGPQGRDFGSDG